MAVLRDLSIILIGIEAFLIALMPLAVLGALVYGLGWLQRHENLPSWLRLAQAYTSLGRSYVELAMALVVRPCLFVNAALATVPRWLTLVVRTGGDNQ
jgi:hypothetical protein